jgi:trehalose-phosphatase
MSPDEGLHEAAGLVTAIHEAAVADRLLVVCDFDGTIAPIVDDPSAARPDTDAVRHLVALAAMPGTSVVLLSGRSRSVLAELSGVAPDSGIRLIGGHGAEHDDAAPPDVEAVHDLVATVRREVAPFAGVELEPKTYGVAIHLRHASQRDAAAAFDAVRRLSARRGLHVLQGTLVVELSIVPTVKGDAIRRLRATTHADRAVILGDDVTDESSFVAADDEDVTVKVGDGGTSARYRVRDVVDVTALLRTLALVRAARPSSGR